MGYATLWLVQISNMLQRSIMSNELTPKNDGITARVISFNNGIARLKSLKKRIIRISTLGTLSLSDLSTIPPNSFIINIENLAGQPKCECRLRRGLILGTH